MTKYIAAATLFTLITAGVCAGQSQPESLGDVAKRNSPHKKAVLVVTEDNISSVSGTISVVGRDTAQTENPPAVAAAKTAEDQSQAEAAPAKSDAQVAELKKKLDEHKQELEGWKQAAKHYQELLATETDDFRRQTYETGLANDRVNIERSQRQVDEAQNALNKARQALNDKSAK